MEFSEILKHRRMVRNYTDQPVERAAVERILDAARRAPSAGFTQGQSFVVVTAAERRKAVAVACGEAVYVDKDFDPWISKAPVQIVACTSEAAYHRRYQEPDKINEDGSEIEWPVPYWHFDIGAAVMLILLGAVNEGLAAGFTGPWDQDRLRELLALPAEVIPVGVVTLGHPAPDRRSPSLKRGRRPWDEVVHWEQWGDAG
ncbi:MAG: nitroreductase family protein [Candidatus Promineifilaceae bacterium]|nr:nitroreductase family protein [Candidatus Promineifilaceae bacterium]